MASVDEDNKPQGAQSQNYHGGKNLLQFYKVNFMKIVYLSLFWLCIYIKNKFACVVLVYVKLECCVRRHVPFVDGKWYYAIVN